MSKCLKDLVFNCPLLRGCLFLLLGEEPESVATDFFLLCLVFSAETIRSFVVFSVDTALIFFILVFAAESFSAEEACSLLAVLSVDAALLFGCGVEGGVERRACCVKACEHKMFSSNLELYLA